eukprot:TRINITY_DN1460_c0_g1_i1.p1 TRINITY_DN1460_c0_g1~~TRINITY_DN1460_c0_g1_i1.p1  ORF type:complete len:138 (+),score=10.77 TRINITY_DN1460_c0_g1_i1:191-604(+)
MRRLVFILVVLCAACCQDLEFWTSLPLSSDNDPILAHNMRGFVGGVQLAFHVANLNSQYGALQNHNVSFRFLDDKGNQSQFQSNIQSIINKPNLLGLLLSSSTDNARYIQSRLNNTIPYLTYKAAYVRFTPSNSEQR